MKLVSGPWSLSLKRLGLFALVIAVVASMLVGCAEVEGVVDEVVGKQEVAQGTEWILLVDRSGSTKRYWPEYQQDLEKVIDGVQLGDKLVVCEIARDAVQNSRTLVDTATPVFVPSSSNPMNVTDERADYEKQNDIQAIRSAAKTSLATAFTERRTDGSDIIGSLFLAQREIAAETKLAQAEKREPRKFVVIVFSDMQATLKKGDFLVDMSKPFDVPAAVKGVEENVGIPQLEGATVVAVGAVSGDAGHGANLRDFWKQYIADGHGQMPDEYFGRRLPSGVLLVLQEEAKS